MTSDTSPSRLHVIVERVDYQGATVGYSVPADRVGDLLHEAASRGVAYRVVGPAAPSEGWTFRRVVRCGAFWATPKCSSRLRKGAVTDETPGAKS